MSKHPHAESMWLYAEDAMETDKPWERWEDRGTITYAIICDARAGEDLGIESLMLVDRSKSKRRWWTSDDTSLGIQYRDLNAARFACRRLRMNNARIVPFAEAQRIIATQADNIDFTEAMCSVEDGWYGHKNSF